MVSIHYLTQRTNLTTHESQTNILKKQKPAPPSVMSGSILLFIEIIYVFVYLISVTFAQNGKRFV